MRVGFRANQPCLQSLFCEHAVGEPYDTAWQLRLGTFWQFAVARLIPHSTLTARATGVIVLQKWQSILP